MKRLIVPSLSKVVIEPHADDAFLSMGAHIEQWTKQEGLGVLILTVYGNAKRNREAKAYAEAVGADWIGLGIPESGKGVKSDPPAFSSGAFDIIEKLSNRWNFISYYLPLAFAHPEHNRVRDSFEKKLGGLVSLFYYIDTPYQLTQKYGTALQHELGGMKIESYLTPPSRKWKHVPLFKSQQLFFHYNPPEKLRNCPEVIVYERGTWL